jgi:hypothetical protein
MNIQDKNKPLSISMQTNEWQMARPSGFKVFPEPSALRTFHITSVTTGITAILICCDLEVHAFLF